MGWENVAEMTSLGDSTQFTKTLPSYTHNIEVYLTKVIAELFKKQTLGTSLVAPWTGVRLPMQETGVQSLVREDPTPLGATKPLPRYRGPAPPPRPRLHGLPVGGASPS